MKAREHYRHGWRVLFLLVLIIGIASTIPDTASAQTANLTIGNYVQVSSTRISRTVYQYNYTASITNPGPGLVNVVATVTSTSPHTTIVSNTLNFGNVAAGATATSTNTFSLQQDRTYPFSWSSLTWAFQWTAAVVGTNGGTLTFANGIVLVVPAGAVTQETTISVNTIPCSNIDPIFASVPYASHPTRCVAAIHTEPSGLVFATPVTATIPVQKPNPGEILVMANVDRTQQTYLFTRTSLTYHGDQGVVETQLDHFSDSVVAALNTNPVPCAYCSTWTPECRGCDSPDGINCRPQPLENPCCLIPNSERLNCDGCAAFYTAPGQFPPPCCKEAVVHSESGGTDYEYEQSGNSCTILCQLVTTQFPFCTDQSGNPTSPDVDSTCEASPDCPNNLTWTLSIDNPQVLPICVPYRLGANLVTVPPPSLSGPALANWSVVSGQAQFLNMTGTIEATQPGDVTVQAELLPSNIPSMQNVPPATATISFQKLDFAISPHQNLTLPANQSAIVNLSCGTVACSQALTSVNWGVDTPGVISLTPQSNGSVQVTAIGPGSTNLIVNAVDDCGEYKVDSIVVTVNPPIANNYAYTLTWSLTISQENYTMVDNSLPMKMISSEDVNWTGEAGFDANRNIQYVKTSGATYYHLDYTAPGSGHQVWDYSYTINGPWDLTGPVYFPWGVLVHVIPGPAIGEGVTPEGPIITVSPFGSMGLSGEEVFAAIPSSWSYTQDFWWDHNFDHVQGDENVNYFSIDMTNWMQSPPLLEGPSTLQADDSTGLSFSAHYVKTYPDYNKTVTWVIKVTKQPQP